jgi:hypothetical protein
MNNSPTSNFIAWVSGLLFSIIGLINTFWGNDPFFGLFILVISLIYLPPVNALINNKLGLKVHIAIKIGLGLFVLWAALGVGELFAKIDLMLNSF